MQYISTVLALVLACSSSSHAAEEIPPYNRSRIVIQRFGERERQELFAKAMQMVKVGEKHIVGQRDLTQALQMAVIEYLNSFGTRAKEPVQRHMIGLNGVGKTTLLELLDAIGLPVIRIDATEYPEEDSGATYRLQALLRNEFEKHKVGQKPLVIFVDELDKVPELIPKKRIQPVITLLNSALSEGRVAVYGKNENVSNVLFITAQNFDPDQITRFATDILKDESGKTTQKTYWDFTI